MNWESAPEISSTVIALCALFFTVWQGRQLQKHNKLSFRPHITSWSHSNPDEGSYTVEIINSGLGPAIIESFTIKIDGEVILGRGTEPIEKGLKLLFPNTNYTSQQAYMAKAYSMAPKERCSIVALQFQGPQLPTKDTVEHALNRADLIIEYKSFYDEEFTYSSAEDMLTLADPRK